MGQWLDGTGVYLGVQGFTARDWMGTFYPPDIPTRDQLPFYAQVFETVELNTTFYSIPGRHTVRSWANRTPEDFVFTAKVPKVITHDKRLEGVEGDLRLFVETMRLLGDKLGPLLIQFPRSFTRRFESRLRQFLRLLPQDLEFAVEFRSRSWIDEGIFSLLREQSVAWCINDWQDMPSVPEITANFTYFRWTGYHDQFIYLGKVQDERIADLQSWAQTVKQVAKRVERIYGYFNNHYTGHAPTTANQFKALLGFAAINPLDTWPQKRDLFPELEE